MNNVIFIFLLFTLVNSVQSQTSPGIEWRKIEWEDTPPTGPFVVDDHVPPLFSGQELTQDESGEDWWYDVEKVYDGAGNHIGYITAGFISFVNFHYDEAAYGGCVVQQTGAMPGDCERRTISGESIALYRQSLGRYDLNGKMIWCKQANIGGPFLSIKQTSDGGFIAIGDATTVFRMKDQSENIYNPNSLATPSLFSIAGGCSNIPYRSRINVVKLDANGNYQWDYLYGYYDLNSGAPTNSDILNSNATGIDIVEKSTGGYIILGMLTDPLNNNNAIPQIFVMEVDANGFVTANRKLYSRPGNYQYWLKSLHSHNGNIFIGGAEYDPASGKASGIVLKLEESTLNMAIDWGSPFNFGGISSNPAYFVPNNGSANIVNEIISDNQHNPVVTMVSECTEGLCAFSGINAAEGVVMKLDNNTGSITSTTNFGLVRAYDMKIGITNTQDGGFAIVSSTRNPDVDPIPNDPILSSTLSYYNSLLDPSVQCVTDPNLGHSYNANGFGFGSWNTNAYVIKLDNNLNIQWSKNFDSDDFPPVNYPGDFKKQECLYRIVQADDGGFVICGNTSHNVDDYYLAKIYSDCQFLSSYSISDPSGTYTVSPGETWNTPQTVKGIVNIPAGITLTIDGTTVEFADSKRVGLLTKIVVQPGANLIIKNGATLTSLQSCENAMWDGIEVRGNRNLDQSGAHQGRIYVLGSAATNSVIENSFNAISVYGRDVNGNIDFNSTGGIVTCQYAKFKNNRRDVEFLTYNGNPSGNRSKFTNTYFITDNALNNPDIQPLSHVSMWDVHGINFYGCSFENTTALSDFPISKRGIGLRTIDATFRVLAPCGVVVPPGQPCPSYINNTFTNLQTGINATATNSINTFEVDQANFSGNQYGLIVSGVDYPKITHNYFEVPTETALGALPFGIYLQQTRFQEIEENTFVNPGLADNNVGIAVYNSGSDPTEIYNNTFNNMLVGELAMGTNRNSTTGDGLQIRCSVNSTNSWDIAATLSGTVAKFQGANFNQSSPAGNLFTHNCVGFDNDYYSQLTNASIFYFSHDNIPPICYTNPPIIENNTGFNYNVSNRQASCPSLPSNQTPPYDHKILAQQYKAIANQGHAQIDGGNTQVLLNAIATQSPGQIKNTLEAASPYLSDAVLIAAINKGLPAGILKQILIPNSPLSISVMNALNAISVPNGIRKQINDAQTGISERSKLEAEIAYYYSKQIQENADYIRYYLLVDTTGNGLDSVQNLLKTEGVPGAKCREAATLLKMGNFSDAQVIIDDHNLNHPQDDYCKLLSVLLDLEQTVEKCRGIDATKKAQIEYLATKEEEATCANAKALLEYVFGNYYPLPVELPNQQQLHSFVSQEQTSNKSEEKEFIKLYPNPAQNQITLEYRFTQENTSLALYDLSGRQLKSMLISNAVGKMLLDISEIPNGMYFLQVRKGQEILQSKKLIIAK